MRSAPWTTRRALATCAVALGSVLSAVALQPGPVGASDREPADWQTRFVATAGRSDTFTLGRTFMEIGPTGKSVILYASGPDENNAFDLRLARGPYPDGSFEGTRRQLHRVRAHWRSGWSGRDQTGRHVVGPDNLRV